MEKAKEIKAIVTIEYVKSGAVILTLRHPISDGQWAKFRVQGGGNLLFRAAKAVYEGGEGDADAYFLAYGMSDEQAFGKDTWK